MTRHPFASILFGLALGLAGCSGPKIEEGDAAAVAPGAGTASATDNPQVAIADTARIQGSPSAAVWLVMASDFQCPACKFWHDTHAPEIMRDYVATGKVRFAYLNFPLEQHMNARAASEAAMCAAAQGGFWGMHDKLFAAQTEWAVAPDPTSILRRLAAESGVDTVAWNQCLSDNVMLPSIDADVSRGRAGGVNQTPYFFVGNQKVGGAIPANRLRQMLDDAIAQASGTTR